MRRAGRTWTIGLGLAAALAVGCGIEDFTELFNYVTFDVDTTPTSLSLVATGTHSVGPDTTAVFATDGPGTEQITITFPGSSTDSLSYPTGGATILYTDASSTDFGAGDAVPSSDYTIDVTGYGPVGGFIEGTFTATVIDVSLNTHVLVGSFHVLRGPDV